MSGSKGSCSGRGSSGAPCFGSGVSGFQGADVDQVVGQDAVADPSAGAFGAVDPASIPAVPTLEGADPAFDAGAPLDGSSERWRVLLGPTRRGGCALARDDDIRDSKGV